MDIEQRGAQQGGQLQVVVGVTEHVAERHHVEHADMGGDGEPVGSGCGDTGADQGADDLVEQHAAHLHQDQHVVGPDGSAAGAERTTGVDPALDLASDALGNLALRRLRHLLWRLGRPVVGIGGVEHVLDRWPQGDGAAFVGAGRLVQQALVLHRALPEIGTVVKDDVDRLEDGRKGAERVAERHAPHGGVHGPRADLVLAAGVDELFRVGALEGKDRLLLVAHRENGARPVGGGVADEEVLDQRVDHVPLLQVGILPLVDEDVADAGIELVAHPRALRLLGEELGQLFDQVVEIEQRAGTFLVFVVGRNGGDDNEHRLGASDQLGRNEAAVERGEAVGLVGKLLRDVRDEHRLGLLQQRLARRALLGEVGIEQRLGIGMLGIHLAQPVDEFAGAGNGEDLTVLVAAERVAAVHLAKDAVDAAHRADPLAQLALGGGDVGQHAAKDALLVQRFDDRLLDGEIRQQAEQRIDGVCLGAAAQAGGEHGLARLLQHAVALVLLQHLEIERHLRLVREAVEDRLAEGVDGLDAQPAWRFERMGEQRAGAQQHAAGWWSAAQLRQVVDQFGLGGQRPLAEPLADAAAHLGSRRLGVGEAEDFLRLHPAEQQAQHAGSEHVGLARTGIGADPHRLVGVGGLALGATDCLRHRLEKAAFAHSGVLMDHRLRP